MKKRGKLFVIAAAVLSLTAVPFTAHAEWVPSEDGRWWNTNESEVGYSVGWELLDGQWYLFDESGWMKTGWIQTGGHWYYLEESGAMAVSKWIGDNYVGADGSWIPARWEAQSGYDSWMYIYGDGSHAVGWKLIDGDWYHFQIDGKTSANNFIGVYYVDTSGKMLTNCWVNRIDVPFDTPNYVGVDGVIVPNAVYHGIEGKWEKNEIGWRFMDNNGKYIYGGFECINDKWYLFGNNGYMETGLLKTTLGTFYAFEDGSLATNYEFGGYYFDSSGGGYLLGSGEIVD